MKEKRILPALGNTIKIASINVLVILVLLELVCLGFYAFQNKQIYYARAQNNAQNEENSTINLDQQGIRLEQNVTEILHPFFGYISKPGVGFGGFEFQSVFHANNYGLVSQANYPYQRQHENQVIIGIFGGSVATFYYMNEIENPTLTRTLKTLPEFADKEIVLLNFSQGGYKQPQQLMILNYFLSQGQELDMVVNIDGFNEVAIANRNLQNGIAPSMPSSLQIMPLIQLANNNFSTEQMQSMLAVIETKDNLKKSLQKQQDCWFALCYSVQYIRSHFLIKRYYHNLEKFEEKRKKSPNPDESLVYLQSRSNQNTNNLYSDSYEEIAQIWVNSSLAMHHVLRQNNIPYFHILQPNQHYPTQRQFSLEEQEQFAPENNTRNPYIEGVKYGYPSLIESSTLLSKNGVNFFNGVNSLDAEKNTVYIDTCCHYNQTGRNIFANYIARQIALTLATPNPRS